MSVWNEGVRKAELFPNAPRKNPSFLLFQVLMVPYIPWLVSYNFHLLLSSLCLFLLSLNSMIVID